MGNENPRSYSCKDEEVPVMGALLLLSFKRDIADFRAFSPKFDEAYVSAFEARITAARDVVEPQSETLAKKLITEKLHQKMDEVVAIVKQLRGYLELAKPALQVSPGDFGINALLKEGNAQNVEGVLKQLNLVITNVNVHKVQLLAAGLSEAKIQLLTANGTEMNELKGQQYNLLTNRKRLVQDNIGIFNEVYDRMNEIMKIGKILYKDTDTVKAQEYTLKNLTQQVHRSAGTSSAPQEAKKQTPAT